MRFILKGIHESFWLFVAWVALRVWEMNFEVSPLPAFLLPLFVFLLFAAAAYLFGRRLQAHVPLDRPHRLGAIGLLVGGATAWEAGLTLYLGGLAGFGAMFTWRFVLGIAVGSAAVFLAGTRLRRLEQTKTPEGLARA